MRDFLGKGSVWLMLSCFLILASGCGETVRGAGRDVQRIGRGIRTIFISD